MRRRAINRSPVRPFDSRPGNRNHPSRMSVEEEFLDVLQNIEAEVVRAWRQNPSMADYAVTRVYEESLAYYTAVAQAQSPKPTRLSGLDLRLFQCVQQAADRRLTGFTLEDGKKIEAIGANNLVDCFKRLRKSVDRWNRTGGRQGYLSYVAQFVK
jgi:hypothetical protein